MKNERYTCERCGYKTDLKGSFKRHIFKAIFCKNKDKDKEVDMEKIRKCFLSSNEKIEKINNLSGVNKTNVKSEKSEESEESEQNQKSETSETSETSEKSEKSEKSETSSVNRISQMLTSTEFQSKVGDNLLERIKQMPESDVLKISCHVGERCGVGEICSVGVEMEAKKGRYVSIVVETLNREENFVTEEYLRWMEKIPLTSHKYIYQAWVKSKPANVRMPKTITIEELF